MNSFVISLLIVLTLSPLLIRSDFCTKYKNMLEWRSEELDPAPKPKRYDYAVKDFKFIPTKDVLYLYLSVQAGSEDIYTFDVKCESSLSCPKIGNGEQLSNVFPGVKELKNAFIHDGFTYFFTNSSKNVLKFENKKKIGEIPETDFWGNITHSTVYKWTNNQKTVVSRFIPPESPKGLPLYQFSFDTFDGNLTVELNGNYNGINICKRTKLRENPEYYMTLYSFGDYLVPTQFYGYLPLPNGDDIFNFDLYPGYVRKSNANLMMHREQNLHAMFCSTDVIPEKLLTDTRSDNIYPNYFT